MKKARIQKKRKALPIRKMKTKLLAVLFCFLCLLNNSLTAAVEAIVCGDLFIRTFAGNEFEAVPEGSFFFADESLIAVAPNLKMPLATDSYISFASHTMVLYPGAVFKVKDYGFRLLNGRINLTSQEQELEPVVFRGAKYFFQYSHGDFFLEVTPKDTSWFLMRNKGSAWVKDFSRTVVEFLPGTEIEIPRFGQMKVSERPGSRWELPPECSVLKDAEAVFAIEKKADDSDSKQTGEVGSESIEISSLDSGEETDEAQDADESEESEEPEEPEDELTGSGLNKD
ncbi:MAG: hypothetical protein PWR01_2103 [Clostridiales bacterium]|nr:hypothetical protein [Clostridiales bacterium]MDN5281030.1 hypothetical protein [Candidatus Ozemobacter sp.]